MTRRAPAVEVQGLKALRKTLKAAGVDLADLKAEHKRVADFVARASAPRAPRSPAGSNRGPSGTLAASVRGAGLQTGAVVRLGRASVPHAGPIYWGHPARHITGRQWIHETADSTSDQWTGLYLAALEDIIRQVEGAPRA
jgi:hypothetical protein